MADNTASLVVALSAQLTKFQKDMQDAGIMADKAVGDIENKFSKMNPQISASFFGNLFANAATKGIAEVENGLADLIQRFKDLEKIAEQTGLSMQQAFAIQQVVAKFGASAADANASLKGLALQLEQLKRGAPNTLSDLIDLNPQAFGNVDKQVLTLQQALEGVAEVVKHIDDPVAKWDIATKLGLTESLVKALNQGGPAIAAMAAEAAASAPPLDQMKNKIDALTGAMTSAWESFKKQVITDWTNYAAMGVDAAAAFMRAWSGNLKDVGGQIHDMVENGSKELDAFQEKMNKEVVPLPQPRPQPVPELPASYKSKLPSLAPDSGKVSAYDRETNAIEKQIAALQAEAATVGETAGAQEEYRVQLILTEKAAQDGLEWTDKLNDAIALQSQRAGEAKQQLAEHTFALQRLNSASQQIGSALSTAFADAIVEGKKFSDVLTSLVQTLEKAAINSLVMNLFTPGAGQTASPLAKLFGFAGGTDFAPGGLAVVGEHGPELVNLPRGSQVIPNDVMKSGIGSGGAIVYSPAIDARGASVDAVARLAQIMESDRATFTARTVATIQQARRGRVPGL